MLFSSSIFLRHRRRHLRRLVALLPKKKNILITKGIGVKKKCLYAAFESIDETRENGDASCLSSEYSTAKKKPTIFFKGVEIAQYIKNFRIVLFSLSLSLQKKLCSMSAFNSTPQKPLCFHPLSSVSFTRQHTCSNYAVDGWNEKRNKQTLT